MYTKTKSYQRDSLIFPQPLNTFRLDVCNESNMFSLNINYYSTVISPLNGKYPKFRFPDSIVKWTCNEQKLLHCITRRVLKMTSSLVFSCSQQLLTAVRVSPVN
jgi:hypothetical protein